jgi:membrane protease YdiL (CAAX protease family)
LLLAVSAPLAWLTTLLPTQRGTVLGDLSPALFVLALVGPAYLVCSRRGRDPFQAHGVFLPPPPDRTRALLASTAVSLVLLGGFVVAYAVYQDAPPRHPLPLQATLILLVHHLLFVALPEEYLFRGVLQPALDRPAGPRFELLGAPFGRGAVLAAALFALAHVAFDPGHSPARLDVFFPALWFAWLRARTGSIVPCVVFHALANATQHGVFAMWADLPA